MTTITGSSVTVMGFTDAQSSCEITHSQGMITYIASMLPEFRFREQDIRELWLYLRFKIHQKFNHLILSQVLNSKALTLFISCDLPWGIPLSVMSEANQLALRTSRSVVFVSHLFSLEVHILKKDHSLCTEVILFNTDDCVSN